MPANTTGSLNVNCDAYYDFKEFGLFLYNFKVSVNVPENTKLSNKFELSCKSSYNKTQNPDDSILLAQLSKIEDANKSQKFTSELKLRSEKIVLKGFTSKYGEILSKKYQESLAMKICPITLDQINNFNIEFMGSIGDDQIEYFSSSNSININPRKVNYIQSSGNIMKPIRLTNKNDFLGMIGFNIEYDFPTRNLIFSDIRGKNFKYIKKTNEVSSCFFKISLLENDEIKTDKCTELSEYMNNPVFSNALKFHLRTDQIGNAVFKFQYVLRKGKNEFSEKGNLALKFKNEFCNQIVNALLDKATKNNYSWYEIKNLVDEDFDKLV